MKNNFNEDQFNIIMSDLGMFVEIFLLELKKCKSKDKVVGTDYAQRRDKDNKKLNHIKNGIKEQFNRLGEVANEKKIQNKKAQIGIFF